MPEAHKAGDQGGSPEKVPLDELIRSSEPPCPERPSESVADNQAEKKYRKKQTQEEQRAQEATNQLKLANRKAAVEIEDHEGRIRRESEDHRLLWLFRRCFGIAGLIIVVLWQTAILWIACSQGRNRLKLSDPVLIALITTTTANVIGLLVIVMKFVFAPIPKPK